MPVSKIPGAGISGGSVTVNQSAPDNSLVVDSSGNVGIGTTSPSSFGKLAVVANSGVLAGLAVKNTATGNVIYGGSYTQITIDSESASAAIVQVGGGGFLYGGGGSLNIVNNSNAPTLFYTNGTERMRITSDGYLYVNTTGTFASGAQFQIEGNSTTAGTAGFRNNSKGTNISHVHYGTFGDWYIRPASSSGKVYVLNYQAESDERLKKDIAPITYGLNEINQLQPKQFKWKEGDGSEVNGFIAQEVESVVPALVSEGQWKSVDYQGITAILVKAVQEQQAQIEELKAKVQALEGNK